MSFDRRDLRRTMDVYTLDNVYLGVVLRVTADPAPAQERAPAEQASSSAVSGELLGPMPTAPLGNRGPRTQSAEAGYGAAPDEAAPLGQGALTVGKWWGLRERRTLPLSAIQSLSLERVTLALPWHELERLRG
jgi:hypothetical protein